MTKAVILQARMTSTRLNGKVLRVVKDRTLLKWIIDASFKIPGIDIVCVATATGAEHDPIVVEAEKSDTFVVRGSETDVLDRFRLAANIIDADQIVRITTDCPLVDPSLCGNVLSLLTTANAHYACNNDPISFPHGLDCEAFTRETLEKAAAAAVEPYEREHVTPWMRRVDNVSKANFAGPGSDIVHWRLTVDYPEDLDFFEALTLHLKSETPSWDEVRDVLCNNPQLHEINRIRRQR